MQESLRKNCPILGKAYMFKGEVTFMRVRVWFDFWRTVILTIRGPRICSTNFGDASGQRHVGGRRRDTHTAKCEHTVKHYCFIDIDYKIQKILQIQKGRLSRGATDCKLHFKVRNTKLPSQYAV